MKHPSNADNWLKIFSKFKDYLLVSICDPDLVSEALVIFHNFLTSPAVKHQVYEECRENELISILYEGNSAECQDKFRQYLLDNVVNRTEDTDNALKKFFKNMLQRFNEKHNELYLSSNIQDIMEKLVWDQSRQYIKLKYSI